MSHDSRCPGPAARGHRRMILRVTISRCASQMEILSSKGLPSPRFNYGTWTLPITWPRSLSKRTLSRTSKSCSASRRGASQINGAQTTYEVSHSPATPESRCFYRTRARWPLSYDSTAPREPSLCRTAPQNELADRVYEDMVSEPSEAVAWGVVACVPSRCSS